MGGEGGSGHGFDVAQVKVGDRVWDLIQDGTDWTARDAGTLRWVMRGGESVYFPTRDEAVEYLKQNY